MKDAVRNVTHFDLCTDTVAMYLYTTKTMESQFFKPPKKTKIDLENQGSNYSVRLRGGKHPSYY